MLAGRSAALVELEERGARPSFDDPAGQAAEHARRAHLDERPHARVVEPVDDVDPADRLGHLPHEALEHVGRLIELAEGGAAEDRHPRSLDRQRSQRGGQLVGRGLKQRRVERARHCQPLRLHAAGFEQDLDRIDDPGRAADDVLLRGIGRADPRLAGEGLDRGRDGRGVGDHREHGAVPRAVPLDGLRPGPSGLDAVGHAPAAGRGERRKLTEAVARQIVGGEPKLLEHAPGKQVAQVHRPLGVPDPRAQAVVGPPGDLGERLAAGGASLRVEPQQHLGRRRHLGNEPTEHVGVLRTLPREDRRHERPTGRGRLDTRRHRLLPSTGRGGSDDAARWGRGRHGKTVVDHHMPGLLVLNDRDAARPEP